MKTIILIACVIVSASMCLAQPAPAVKESSGQKPASALVVNSSNEFAADLYAKLAAGQKGNLFFSPGSIDTALAMTYAGAAGDTAEQMAKTLHLTLAADKLAPAYAELLKMLTPVEAEHSKGLPVPPAYQLVVANALWGQKGLEFKDDFTQLLKKSYGAGMNEVDFAKSGDARKTINDWVAKQTKDKIKDLIADGVLNDQTRLVLANAIYFKSNWAEKFQKDATKDEPFTVSVGKLEDTPLKHIVSVNVPMMHQQHRFEFLELFSDKDLKSYDLQLLILPYAREELSMVVILPKEVEGISNVEKSLTAENLARWISQAKATQVEVSLPKFTFSSEFLLADPLKAMGMTDAFDSAKADFSGMTSKEKLFISAVIHKAFVAVDEEGTEAAAATAVVMEEKDEPAPAKPKVFKADHPFFFLIRHNSTGEILFMGRVVNPKGEEATSKPAVKAVENAKSVTDPATGITVELKSGMLTGWKAGQEQWRYTKFPGKPASLKLEGGQVVVLPDNTVVDPATGKVAAKPAQGPEPKAEPARPTKSPAGSADTPDADLNRLRN